ncbi:2371_t:CDS:1, partial [Dentiscutata heterogama]
FPKSRSPKYSITRINARYTISATTAVYYICPHEQLSRNAAALGSNSEAH